MKKSSILVALSLLALAAMGFTAVKTNQAADTCGCGTACSESASCCCK